jgi:hypothetical protein
LFSLHEFFACFIALEMVHFHDFALCALLLRYDEAMNGLFVLLLVSNGLLNLELKEFKAEWRC